MREKAVANFLTSLELKDPYTREHSERVADYACMIGRELGFCEEELSYLRDGALLHDIGKLAIRDEVLKKCGGLTPEEFEEMKLHPLLGTDMVADEMKYVISTIRYHHERVDGKGYPYGITGEAIPVWTKIVTVAGSFDALLTDERMYNRRYTVEEAIEVLENEKGKWFDAQIVDTFVNILKKRR